MTSLAATSPIFRALPGVQAPTFDMAVTRDELALLLDALAGRAARLEGLAKRGRPGGTAEKKAAAMRKLRQRLSTIGAAS